MNLHCVLIGIVVLLLTAGPSQAARQPPPFQPLKGPGCGVTTQGATTVWVAAGGTISGVVSKSTSAPLGGAEVWACHEQPGGTGQFIGAKTNAEGRYSFIGLKAGYYQVSFVDPTGQHAYQFWNNSGQNAPSSSYATTLIIGDGTILAPISRTLPRAGKITGLIRNRLGQRLANIQVTVDIQDLSGLYEETPIDPVLSYQDGSYTISGLPTSSRYRLTFSDPQGRYQTETLSASATSGITTTASTVTLSQ